MNKTRTQKLENAVTLCLRSKEISGALDSKAREQLQDALAHRDRLTAESAFEHVKALGNMVNAMGNEKVAEAVADAFIRQHRTIQANMVRCLIYAISAFARRLEEKGAAALVDLRNQDAADALVRMDAAVKDAYIPFI